MQTVSGARSWAIEELKRAQIDSPMLTGDLLLGFVLGWTRVRLLSHPEQTIQDERWARFRSLVHRRANGEPLQHLTGEQEFFGLTFRVTPDVLIPRPETEILVEKALELIKSYCSPNVRFADIGTGSGCVAISIASEVPSSRGFAVDISSDALNIAQENAKRHGVDGRIVFARSDLLGCFPEKPCLDFVFCNPPYIALDEYDSLPTEVRNHEPPRALFGGKSGFDIYRRLIPQVSSRLAAGGYLLLELGAGQAQQVRRMIANEGFSVQSILNDLQGIPRCLVGQKAFLEK